jgi:hypothetical protein
LKKKIRGKMLIISHDVDEIEMDENNVHPNELPFQ